jgi:predicted nucleotidyltransferase
MASTSGTRAMRLYTPLERSIFKRLADEIRAADLPVTALRVFGSRARGRSRADSDLDIAVEVDCARDPALARRIQALGERVSVQYEDSGHRLRVQTVPMFRGDAAGFLGRTIERELDTVWTRT